MSFVRGSGREGAPRRENGPEIGSSESRYRHENRRRDAPAILQHGVCRVLLGGPGLGCAGAEGEGRGPSRVGDPGIRELAASSVQRRLAINAAGLGVPCGRRRGRGVRLC